MKAIDFGKSRTGQDIQAGQKLDDLKYMFNRKAIGIGDSIRRSYREAGLPMADVDSVNKHYPLHRLLAQVHLGIDDAPPAVGDGAAQMQMALARRVEASDQFNEPLASVGDQLVSDLQTAEADPNKVEMVEAAFQRAAQLLDQAASRML